MPSACSTDPPPSSSSTTTTTESESSSSSTTTLNGESNGNGQTLSNDLITSQNGNNHHSSTTTTTKMVTTNGDGFTEEDVDDELPSIVNNNTANDQQVKNDDDIDDIDGKSSKPSSANIIDESFVLIHDNSFNIKLSAPGIETFDLQVSPVELVQEINHQLIDREDTCHRTCFSLQLDGVTLDNFSELKNIDGLKEGSMIRVIEEPYTVREARIHVRHVRDLLKSLDMSDSYNGVDCNSLSFMNIIAQNDLSDIKKTNKSLRSDLLDCLPPDYVLPITDQSNNNNGNNNNNNNNNVNNQSVTNNNSINNTNGNNNNNINQNNNNQQGLGINKGCDVQLTPLEPQIKDLPKTPSALKVLTASGWNPPPGHRKLRGDLMYLYVVTLEEKRFHITSSTRGFYVNLSTDEVFNPKPSNPKLIFHSLVELLSHISAAFKRNYSIIQKRRYQRHPFERLVTPYQVYTWAAPQIDHTVDSIRAEDAFSSKLGYEEHMPGQTRDWNEELQTTRELPRKTLSERIIRERAIFKVHSDFVAAATRGAMAVVDGNVLALNPNEDTKMQMFIWNNIFFSLGFDVRDHYKEVGGDAAAYAAPSNDLHGVRAYSSLNIDGLYTLATAVVDYKGYRVTAQSIIPGILERDQEQSVVYGSIDFGKNVVSHPKYLELLKKAGSVLKIVPHKVISQGGEMVEICSSVECKGIIGNDGRHYILDLLRTFPPDPHYVLNDGEELSQEMRDAGYPRRHKHKLSSLRQELIDAFFESRYLLFIRMASFYLQQSDTDNKLGLLNKNKQQAQIESQSKSDIDNDDDEKKTVNEEETNKDDTKQESSTTSDKKDDEISKDYEKIAEKIVSPAKIANQMDEKTTANVSTSTENETIVNENEQHNTKEIIRKAANDVGSLSDCEFDVRFNPDIFSPGVVHADSDSETFKRQKQLIKDAAEFLVKIQIPTLVRELLDHSIYLYDGLTLTDAFRSRGINIRYLGKFTEILSKQQSLDYAMSIAVCELICRSIKHMFVNYMQSVEVVYMATAISHFLNCFLSSTVTQPSIIDEIGKHSKRRGKKFRNGRMVISPNENGAGKNVIDRQSFDWLSLTPKSFWTQLRNEMDSYYGWIAPKDIDSVESLLYRYSIQKISLLRIVCIRTGIQVLLREYNFDHKSRPAFTDDDILNVFPIVKHISPRANDAYNLFQNGQRKISEGNIRDGYDYISEALNLFNSVYGPLHPDIVQCLRLLGRINYVLGDYSEACSYQQKAVLMSEKVNGIDHPHTITEYNFLALYSFANSQISAALKFLYRTRYLLSLIHSQNHPEMAIIDSNIGLILHAIGEYDYSLRFLEHALQLNLRYFGKRNLKVALSYHLLARTLSCMGDFRGALNNEKETYMIYKKELGENHEKTKESSDCLRHLTNQAVVLQKKMNEIYKGNMNTIIPPIQIQPPSINSVMELLNVINGILFLHISAQDVENLRELQTIKTKRQQNQQQQQLDQEQEPALQLNNDDYQENQQQQSSSKSTNTNNTSDNNDLDNFNDNNNSAITAASS
uniref:Clustered mitochondria protein homolog n=1 Tax=Dermatophagoides pteronyssinus TaxID=6956 RepID=A0A6P6YC22_DERPT|nr:clustered mitochondria protein homolog [Dermatophagoides pteronyssinus]